MAIGENPDSLMLHCWKGLSSLLTRVFVCMMIAIGIWCSLHMLQVDICVGKSEIIHVCNVSSLPLSLRHSLDPPFHSTLSCPIQIDW